MRKVFRPVGIIFKGSGFYTTDYRKPEAKREAEESKKEAEESKKEPASSASSKREGSE